MINDNPLKRRGIDAHEVKREYLGEKAPIALYDLSVNKSTGQIFILRKKGKGNKSDEPLPTHYFIK